MCGPTASLERGAGKTQSRQARLEQQSMQVSQCIPRYYAVSKGLAPSIIKIVTPKVLLSK